MRRVLVVVGFIFMMIGLIAIIPIFLSGSVTLSYTGQFLDLEQLSNIGSYIAGTSGIFISFAGIIFVYLTLKTQINQLKLQKIDSDYSKKMEMYNSIENKIFELSRRINSHIDKLKFNGLDRLGIKIDNEVCITNIYFLHLTNYLDDQLNESKGMQTIDPFIKFVGFLKLNLLQVSSLYNLIDDCISYIRIALPLSGLNEDQMNILKDIFFINLGEDFVHFSDVLCASCKLYRTILKNTGKTPSHFDPIEKITRKISIFISFKDKYYSADTTECYKNNIDFYMLSHHSICSEDK